MDRPRLIRGLRIAWSVWWGILCVLLVVLWVRSYFRQDVVFLDRVPVAIQLSTYKGTITYLRVDNPFGNKKGSWSAFSTPIPTMFQLPRYSYFDRNCSRAPLWIPVLGCIPLGAASWVRWKFSLRTLLVATTLIAVVLGTVAYFRL